ncbi:MAG: twin-arginine translocase subunit TatC [Limnothrix sp.]
MQNKLAKRHRSLTKNVLIEATGAKPKIRAAIATILTATPPTFQPANKTNPRSIQHKPEVTLIIIYNEHIAQIDKTGISPTLYSTSPMTSLQTKTPTPETPDPKDELTDDVEMSFFDHLEELRLRIFYGLIAVVLGWIACFFFVKPIVQLLEAPAAGVKFIQVAPGEFFFLSFKVAGYTGALLASPVILYQVIAFVLPGLTQKERRLLGPVVIGSGVLFFVGLAFSYVALIPAALNFFITYGADVVEAAWSIESYFELVLGLMFFTGLAFQVPVIQMVLALLGIVTSELMLKGWRLVILGSVIMGAVITPSTDPMTQSLLAGAILGLYFGGIGVVKLSGR